MRSASLPSASELGRLPRLVSRDCSEALCLEVTAHDPLTFVIVPVMLATVAQLAIRIRTWCSGMTSPDSQSRCFMVVRKAAICLLTIVATVLTTVSVTSQTRALAITRVNVVDVVDGRIVPNSTVTISGTTITGVSQNSAPPADARGGRRGQ